MSTTFGDVREIDSLMGWFPEFDDWYLRVAIYYYNLNFPVYYYFISIPSIWHKVSRKGSNYDISRYTKSSTKRDSKLKQEHPSMK